MIIGQYNYFDSIRASKTFKICCKDRDVYQLLHRSRPNISIPFSSFNANNDTKQGINDEKNGSVRSFVF